MKSENKTLETSKISKNSFNDSSFIKIENITNANEGIGKSPQILFKKNNNQIKKNFEPKNLFSEENKKNINKNSSFIKTQNKISLTTNLMCNLIHKILKHLVLLIQ